MSPVSAICPIVGSVAQFCLLEPELAGPLESAASDAARAFCEKPRKMRIPTIVAAGQ